MKATALPPGVKPAFIAAMVLAFGAALLDNGVVGWLVAPFVLGLSFFAMARAPLRSSLLVLMFLGLTLENPSEIPGFGQWHTPWFSLGSLMLMHLKNTIGGGLFFSGMDVMLAWLGIVAIYRRSRRPSIDSIGNFQTPKILIRLAQASLATILLVFIVGQLRGGADMSMAVWQMDRVMYLPILFLLFQAGLRGEADVRAVAKVVLLAAGVRACQAMYVRATIWLPPDPMTGEVGLPYATTHHDSILFASACVLLCALVIQRVPKTTWLVLLTFPIFAGGMVANNRRMVWVQLMLVLLTVYFSTPPNATKKQIKRYLKFLSPVLIVYGVVGWGSTAGVFKPVNIIRSAVDSSTDSSTQWRDIENFDLLYTIHQFPFFGAGYGQHFFEVISLPAVDYALELYIPHNSILGLWAFYGYFGFMGITSLWVGGVYCGMRAYRRIQSPEGKAAALFSFGAIQIYYIQCYGDMGLGSWTGVFIVAPALATAAKLAVSSGAWRNADVTPAQVRAPREATYTSSTK
ncbi:MAG: O-antigen ligase family protein [Polyangiaceae bacterium]